jgi:hypothetical protein
MLCMPGEPAAFIDLTRLPAGAAALIAQLQRQVQAQAQAQDIAQRQQEIARCDREIAWAHDKLNKLTSSSHGSSAGSPRPRPKP